MNDKQFRKLLIWNLWIARSVSDNYDKPQWKDCADDVNYFLAWTHDSEKEDNAV